MTLRHDRAAVRVHVDAGRTGQGPPAAPGSVP